MLLNPRVVSVILGGCISLITTAFLSLVPGISVQALLVGAGLALSSSIMLIYLTLEFLIFREIQQIYVVLDELKKKDVGFKIKKKKLKASNNPLKKLHDEIFSLATRKQAEIDELKRMENFRKEFLADVSHELRTPIFAAQGFVHTLLDGAVEDPDVRDKFLKKAAKSLDGLDAMVQDLLTLSKMESGAIRMQFSQFDLVPLMQEVFDQLEKKAHKRNVQLLLQRKSNKPIRIEADRNRIRQALVNLVENGVKYAGENSTVTVALNLSREYVYIAVSDNGPGIPQEHQKRIFERFYRIDKSRSKGTGGSGLGLAIVKHVVEAHHSTITVSSKVGKGTTFTFRLKRVPTPTTVPAITPQPAENALGPSALGQPL